ncbi:MAG: DICT sensory domain-containing protein [Aggregatilineales bacterium]
MSDFAIDPDFSVYQLVKRLYNGPMELHTRRIMTQISYTIEDMIRVDQQHNRLFSGFQLFSKFLPQEQRYRQIAAYAESVYVFGVDDVCLPSIPRITYVPLSPSDRLSKEWFVLSAGPAFSSALCAVETTNITDPDHLRAFKGLWTFDADMVDILQEWLSSAVGAPPLALPAR